MPRTARIDIYNKETIPFSDDDIKNTSEKSMYINENGAIIKRKSCDV